ncbi:MAG: sugar transferase [Deltaproteobacteria bacterium]|nr:MAG: sugar transferase [Deltaproteobacteria bacterium]
MSKRIFDFTISFLSLLLLFPFLLIVSIMIKWDSPGPVFFKQKRAGENGKEFNILKFRTMINGAEKLGPHITSNNDPRITKMGRLIRWGKLDEFPQLINVLKGEMSLVGPRPEIPVFVREYTPEQKKILLVKPGITGPAQIYFRNESKQIPSSAKVEDYYRDHILPEKLKIDLEYLQSRSFLFDLKYLFITIGKILS